MFCPADLLSFTSAKLPLLPEHSHKNRGKVYDQVSEYTSPPGQDDKGHLIPNFRKIFKHKIAVHSHFVSKITTSIINKN